MTPGQVAALEKVQPQSLTRTLSNLESEQLITREADPEDGRRSLLAITNQGLLALRNDMSERDAWLARTMAELLTGTERELLRLAAALLERLAEVGGVPPGGNRPAAADQQS
jgi:DNA-binding MarR family transcriptional regulator